MQKVKVSDKSWKVTQDGTIADTVTENKNIFKILRKKKANAEKDISLNMNSWGNLWIKTNKSVC